ncbi:hypothetical protein IU501_33205 [Nocardia otitidiscaviarum]|uniref:hypothetical protein n=1 Tax=Nocardia otitidiscaviarum TaxID=1823 RepID=UPI0006941478|nr:hypothetical protein [Nocardia otitidiscaviarum]MBF6137831.1 hypothetical protein [Nocardia otitidiscaviarum]MBF6485354.1 hypothetical protein [Nocardia otitidiscaviarum]
MAAAQNLGETEIRQGLEMDEIGGDGADVSSQRVFAARESVLHLVPSPWDRDVFLERLGQLRGRPIRLVPVSSPPVSQESSRTPCGLWLEGEAEDFIVYDARTTQFHVDQIVAHEAGHMLLDHAQGSSGLAGVAQLMPDIDPAAIRGFR